MHNNQVSWNHTRYLSWKMYFRLSANMFIVAGKSIYLSISCLYWMSCWIFFNSVFLSLWSCLAKTWFRISGSLVRISVWPVLVSSWSCGCKYYLRSHLWCLVVIWTDILIKHLHLGDLYLFWCWKPLPKSIPNNQVSWNHTRYVSWKTYFRLSANIFIVAGKSIYLPISCLYWMSCWIFF